MNLGFLIPICQFNVHNKLHCQTVILGFTGYWTRDNQPYKLYFDFVQLVYYQSWKFTFYTHLFIYLLSLEYVCKLPNKPIDKIN